MHILFPLALAILILPLADLILLPRVAHRLGSAGTLIWLGSATILGLFLWLRAPRRSERGPEARDAGARTQVFSALHLVMRLAGLLLMFPGPITDLLAGVLLVPPLRRLLTRWLLGGAGAPLGPGFSGLWGARGEDPGRPEGSPQDVSPGGRGLRAQRGPVRDAEFEVLPEDRTNEAPRG